MTPPVPLWITAVFLVGLCGGHTRGDEPLPSIEEKTQGTVFQEGLLRLYKDERRGRVWLEVPPPTRQRGWVGEYLYVSGLRTGLGSNPVGLDRGQLGRERVIVLRRLGGRVLIDERNLRYRALTDHEEERQAVDESFATSVLWGGEVTAQDADGTCLVDFTPFLLRDAHAIARRLKATAQGEFTLDGSRSAVDIDACLSFPENLEFEALLTYSSQEPGALVAETVPSADAVTLYLHHSILALPDTSYRPRRFDPRVGCFSVGFLDYASPLDEPLEKRWIVRHRLIKQDPSAARSAPVEPIIYYVDRGAPEPVRSALLDGARWWAAAFEAAGFVDAFRVELLPAGAHPLDARYNVIQWVHRSTRGWSFGGGIQDPRTGEMIKGHVTLGSQRVRQDRLLFEGLLGTEATGTGVRDDPIELSLARLRQLAAHEVGHTLGLAHNFAASTYGDRASVMDYPAPRIRVLDDDSFDVSEAYGVGVGAWDIHCIRYGYSEFSPQADEDAGLTAIVAEGLRNGLRFVSDADARPAHAQHPFGHLWDNGDDPIEALRQALRVRAIALERFGERNIARGRPLAFLEEVLAPVYFHHRYQLDATVKLIGGYETRYAVRGDGQPPARPVPGETQRRALSEILTILDPPVLDLRESVLRLLLPRPFGYRRNREMFGSGAAPSFDALGVAETAADGVVRALLNPERCARLVDFHRRDPTLPPLREVLRELVSKVFTGAARERERWGEIRRGVQRVVVQRFIELSRVRGAGAVRGEVDAQLRELTETLESAPVAIGAEFAHRQHLRGEIARHFARPAQESPHPRTPADPPPGAPIGAFVPWAGCTADRGDGSVTGPR